MDKPLLLWNVTHDGQVTGIFIPLSGDEALNLQHALRLRESGFNNRDRVIVELYHSYTSFEIALFDLDAKLKAVLGGTDNNGGSSLPDTDAR